MNYTDHQAYTVEFGSLVKSIVTRVQLSQVQETPSGEPLETFAIWEHRGNELRRHRQNGRPAGHSPD